MHNTTKTVSGLQEPKRETDASRQAKVMRAAIAGAIAALSQPVTFTRERSDREHVRAYKILSADVETAKQWLKSAI